MARTASSGVAARVTSAPWLASIASSSCDAGLGVLQRPRRDGATRVAPQPVRDRGLARAIGTRHAKCARERATAPWRGPDRACSSVSCSSSSRGRAHGTSCPPAPADRGFPSRRRRRAASGSALGPPRAAPAAAPASGQARGRGAGAWRRRPRASARGAAPAAGRRARNRAPAISASATASGIAIGQTSSQRPQKLDALGRSRACSMPESAGVSTAPMGPG